MLRRIVLVPVLAASLAACESDRYDRTYSSRSTSNETVGMLGGAAVGGLLGSQFGSGSGNTAATVLGVALGALAGREIAKSMSDDGRRRAWNAERDAVARNDVVIWDSPDGYRGTVRPMSSFTDREGRECRRYTHTVEVNGRREASDAVACRDRDGEWTTR